MKKLISLLVIFSMLLLSSCSTEIDTNTTQTTAETLSPPSITTTPETEPEPIVNQNNVYNSKEKIITPNFTLDLSDENNFNSTGLLFIPNSSTEEATIDKFSGFRSEQIEETEYNSDAHADKLASEFLSSLKNKIYDVINSCAGVDYNFYKEQNINYFQYFDNIDIIDYSIKRLNEKMNYRFYSVMLNIGKSDNKRYPVGKSYYKLVISPDDMNIYSQFIPVNEIIKENYEKDSKFLKYAFELIEYDVKFGNGVTLVKDINLSDLKHTVSHLMASENIPMSLPNINKFIEKTFDISTGLPESSIEDWLISSYSMEDYKKDSNAAIFGCEAHGGNYINNNIYDVYYDETTKTNRVVVALYNDQMEMTIGQIVEFVFKGKLIDEIPQFVSVNVLYNNNFQFGRVQN